MGRWRARKLCTPAKYINAKAQPWREALFLTLKKHFDVETAKRQLKEYRMLILDGQKSHYTLDFIEHYYKSKIILLILPPHMTHLLQPLDVAIFQPLAKHYSVQLEDHCHFVHRWLEKEDFVKYYQTARKKALSSVNIMSAWRKTGLIPLTPKEVLSKLPNKLFDPPDEAQLQLIVNESPPVDLLIGASSNYVEKATEAVKRTVLGSPAKQAIETIEFLNANNAILSKLTTDLVATARSHKESKKRKRVVNQARFLSKADTDRLREEQEAKERAEIAHKHAMEEKRHQQALKKFQMETEKAERAERRAVAKDAHEINAEMVRMARIYRSCLLNA